LVNISGAFSQRVDLYVEEIEKVVDEFRDQLPSEISLEKVYDESYYFKEKFNTLYTSILFAILIVIGISYFLWALNQPLLLDQLFLLLFF
jgi:multidrug efflux pump subunit AcrB